MKMQKKNAKRFKTIARILYYNTVTYPLQSVSDEP